MTTQSRFEPIGFPLADAESPAKLRRKSERRAQYRDFLSKRDAYPDLTFGEFLRLGEAGFRDERGDNDAALPSTPEPPPIPAGEPITPALVAWLTARGLTRAAELVVARDAYGRAKYGQPLRLDDGRDAVEDCRQELGDALQYAYRALRRGDDTRELIALAQALVRLLAEGVSHG